jgi:hypothetical protein
MPDFRDLAHDPKHRRRFEHLLYLAAARGDDDLVAERLSWGVDPNCTFRGNCPHLEESAELDGNCPSDAASSAVDDGHTTPLIANVRGSNPNAATVRALLRHGADPVHADEQGLTALDYARRKLMGVTSRLRRQPPKSPSLDENNQLQLSPEEQAELDDMRKELGDDGAEYIRLYWKERLRAARRVFNDPDQIEQIVELLEAAERQVE